MNPFPVDFSTIAEVAPGTVGAISTFGNLIHISIFPYQHHWDQSFHAQIAGAHEKHFKFLLA